MQNLPTVNTINMTWSKWAMKIVINAKILPLHAKHIKRSMITIERILETIEKDYVDNNIQQFNVMDFYHNLYRKNFKPQTPGLVSIIGGIRLLSCTGVITLTENSMSFEEKTAKSISIVTIKTPANYEDRFVPIKLFCINTFCMFAVEHPEKLLPSFHKDIPYETLIPFCTNEPIDIDSISTATIFIKVLCKLCTILMDKGYSVGLSVRCKESTSRYGNRFQEALAKSAIECGTQLKISTNNTTKELLYETKRPKSRTINPINYQA